MYNLDQLYCAGQSRQVIYLRYILDQLYMDTEFEKLHDQICKKDTSKHTFVCIGYSFVGTALLNTFTEKIPAAF